MSALRYLSAREDLVNTVANEEKESGDAYLNPSYGPFTKMLFRLRIREKRLREELVSEYEGKLAEWYFIREELRRIKEDEEAQRRAVEDAKIGEDADIMCMCVCMCVF